MPKGKTRFDRCVKAVRKRGGAYDPEAVCGAMRARRTLNPAVEVRPSQRFKGRWEVAAPGYPIETRKSKRGAISWANGWAKALTERKGGDWRVEVRENPARVTQRDVDAAAQSYHNNMMAYGENNMATQRAEFRYRDLLRAHNEQKAKRQSKKNAAPGSKMDILEQQFRRARTPKTRKRIEAQIKTLSSRLRRNPAAAAAEAYEKFHGEPPTKFTTITEKIHHHGNLWSLGDLTALKIRAIDGKSIVKLSGFRGAFLAANEGAFKELTITGRARAQLFIKGGDQSIRVEDFGIDPDRAHEVETLGQATFVGYKTNKVHLGDEGGDAVYEHKFRRTREGDAEIKVRWARYPDVIYRVLDERLEFSGGSYELIAEGINL